MDHRPPTAIGRIIAELERRRVFRTAGLYAAAAFVVLQAADLAVDPLGLPQWTMKLLWLLALLGFPVALLLAWLLDIVPDADTAPVQRDVGVSSGRRTSIAAVAVVVLAGGAVAFATSSSRTADAGERSIAVLPFADMSATKDQVYLSDGLTEDILTRLAGISGLRVISRTSVMTYRDSDKTVPQIAAELQVGFVLEGSVRRVGDRVRVTAQLIRADADENVWAENYDRDATDLLALQDEIAAEIAGALRIRLTSTEQDRLERGGTIDPVAYDLFLRARALLHSSYGSYGSGREAADSAARMLHRVVEIAPDFAPAYAGLAHSVRFYRILVDGPQRDSVASWARRAVELDPALAEGYVELAHAAMTGAEKLSHLRRALALSPNDAETLQSIAEVHSEEGRLDEAVRDYATAAALDPADPDLVADYTRELGRIGLHDRAETVARERLRPQSVGYGECWLAHIAAGRGDTAAVRRHSEALVALGPAAFGVRCAALNYLILGEYEKAKTHFALTDSEPIRKGFIAIVTGDTAGGMRLLDRAEALIMERLVTTPWPEYYELAQVHALRGETAEAVESLEAAAGRGKVLPGLRRDPLLRPLHGNPRFESLADSSEAELRRQRERVVRAGW